MRDFYTIKEKYPKMGVLEIYPEFKVIKSKDLMVQGKNFYAVWDEDLGLWTQDEYAIKHMVDSDLWAYREKVGDIPGTNVIVKCMEDDSTGMWHRFQKYIADMPNNYHQLDSKITFSNTEVTKKDYISKRLPYALQEGNIDAWDELVGTLYFPEEREKIEWAIGAVVSGDSKTIQKFMVFYGDPGHGKGTILDIIKQMFEPYCASFDAGELTGFSSFPMEQFASNPLVAIQFDGDLSHIATNTKLNSLVSHEMMTMKEKYKRSYDFIPQSFLFLASNEPVKISNGKSGIIRRLIDVTPSMQRIPEKRYFQLKNQVKFELGAIAYHCLQVYEEMGKHYYEGYKPVEMMFKTDPFFNFVDFYYLVFSRDDGTTLKAAYEMYKDYCENSNIQRMPMYKFREELKNYFRNFEAVARIDDQQVRSWYSGFKREKFDILRKGDKHDTQGKNGDHGSGERSAERGKEAVRGIGRSIRSCEPGILDSKSADRGVEESERAGKDGERQSSRIAGEPEGIEGGGVGDIPEWLRLTCCASILDEILKAQPAQYANEEGKPTRKWAEVETRLGDIDTGRVHYVRPPLQHVVIDFDKKDKDGNKSLALNLQAASAWKPTYAEVSQGGQGLHLHYVWDGDISELANLVEPDVEIKKFGGNSSLRRRVSRCNDLAIAHLSSGLPRKEAKKTVNFDSVKSEKSLRNLIERNLAKEIHPGTKPSIDFIEKILEDAYNSGLHYDVTDMRPDIMDFAIHSTHQSDYCLTRVAKMKFKSDEISDPPADQYLDDRMVFFDIEVFPNLILVNWKFAGDDVCQRMINPKPMDIEKLLKYKLVGFNCRRYDNHILYAVLIGKTIPEVYDISQGIINGSRNSMFGEAYNISYTDVYDFCSQKQSLKKWEIELGIHHQELGLPWDKPVPEEKWLLVAEYCDNDVFATEAVFNARQADWTARNILADLAGMTVNDTTNSLTTRIIFGNEKHPKLNYRFLGDISAIDPEYHKETIKAMDLDPEYTKFTAECMPIFPGYLFDHGVSTYRGEVIGEGGYVYAEQAIHRNVALLDIASMHPTSVDKENLFEDHTQNFRDIKDARIFIKHKDYESAKKLFNGKLAKYLDDPAQAKALAGALKIAINSVYGLTSAKFDNAFRDIRNVDNIVAKRGALFMVNLKHEVQKRGFTVAHIKTDSIKIPDATPEIIQFVMDYGKLYGYTFEHEATYDRMCLVNDAVYIARYSMDELNEHPGEWTATGTQFQVPFVFKSLFSKEPIRFADLCETKSCTTALYLDMNEGLEDVSDHEKEADKIRSRIRKLNKTKDDPAATEADIQKAAEEAEDLKKDLSVLKEMIAKGHDYVFIGKVGLFAPVIPGKGGGLLVREKDGKYYAVGGTSGYRWLEAETLYDHLQDVVDMRYFTNLSDEAVETINQYGDFWDFVDESGCSNGGLPWEHRPNCGEYTFENCLDCPHWRINLDAEKFEEYFGCDIQ